MFAHIVCAISPIDRNRSGATTPGQSGPGSNGYEGVLHIPQISKAIATPSNCLVSYAGHWLGWERTPTHTLQRYSRCILQPQLGCFLLFKCPISFVSNYFASWNHKFIYRTWCDTDCFNFGISLVNWYIYIYIYIYIVSCTDWLFHCIIILQCG